MSQRDYVSLEQAKKLREQGFNWSCEYSYSGGSMTASFYCYDSDPYAPDLDTAHKWLREVKGLYILVWICACGYGWEILKCSTPENMGTTVLRFDEESGDDEPSGMFTTYEKALFDAIDNALELI